jgi:hypothetical protein
VPEGDSPAANCPPSIGWVQAGKIRVGMHSFYTKDSRTGELRAVSTEIIFLDIARILGARIGVEVLPVWHPTIPEMLTCLTAGECDVGFMGPDPSRAGVDFSPPILQLDYTFLLPAGSSPDTRKQIEKIAPLLMKTIGGFRDRP